jgi:hypothetical protein
MVLLKYAKLHLEFLVFQLKMTTDNVSMLSTLQIQPSPPNGDFSK